MIGQPGPCSYRSISAPLRVGKQIGACQLRCLCVAVAAIRKINKETHGKNEAKRRRGERIEMPLPLTPKIPFSIDIVHPGEDDSKTSKRGSKKDQRENKSADKTKRS
jgi:hypothetical protein